MTETKKRLPFMSARQIALTAVIGGIAFICEAIGLWLPTPWPGGTINIGGFAITLAAMVAGPWSGMIVGWLDLFPMAGFGPIAGWLYFWTPLYTAATYKPIYRLVLKNKKLGVIVFAANQLFNMVFPHNLLFAWWFSEVTEAFPTILSAWVYITVVGTPIFAAIYVLLPAIVLYTATDFVEPRWTWFPPGFKRWKIILPAILIVGGLLPLILFTNEELATITASWYGAIVAMPDPVRWIGFVIALIVMFVLLRYIYKKVKKN
jgi:hypothetical protein